MTRTSALTWAVVAAIVASCGAGCTAASSLSTASRTAPASRSRAAVPATSSSAPLAMLGFAGDDVSFQYPAAWQARQWEQASSLSALITYLSPNALHNPCSRSKIPRGIQVVCGSPIKRLPAGGVLVTWTSDGFPTGPGPLKLNARVGGLPAAETLSMPGSCAAIGANETVRVVILRADAADNWYTMTACLRSPGLRQDERAIQAMLKTFHARG